MRGPGYQGMQYDEAYDYYRTLGHKQVWLWSQDSPEGQRQRDVLARALHLAQNGTHLGFDDPGVAEDTATAVHAILEALKSPQKAVTEVPDRLYVLAPALRWAKNWAWIQGLSDREWVYLRHWSQLAGTYRGQYVELPGDYDRDELRETLHIHGFTKKEF